ncbi:Hydroxyethylthiazole kinase isoform A [Micractinium conductrix]|uniref:hydroxyethylthiazole kinase n=1 Tax=Micractinium conductrix TaxID=554055 RepID=A0A2P6VL52_9CHLO|nr:Hydroxyethylthiazole kinase isoform B [Micractinium conductrix]PSC74809.1 Hydroxyethylthiazole kinase isoform A [Micractinium conductrix]|eukprot:PSC74808.1 Hydroxyethylthiazole kinase isoform B [Micractinium conductrix]
MQLEASAAGCWAALQACRERSPLVQCTTNFVSMDIMANTLLAAGASPAMAHSIGEVEDFVGIASALLVNVGTLSDDWVGGMRLGAQAAVAGGKPWVLDPVGCGATLYRSEVCAGLLRLKPTIVRGNASEILALAGAAGGPTKGVDSTAAADDDALHAAQALARQHGCVVAVSGAEDLVTDGSRVLRVANGVPLLQQITATGCSVTALVAAFVCLFPGQPLEENAAALSYFGLAAELAAADGAKGPGSLRVGLLDHLWTLSQEQVLAGSKIREG